MWWEAKARTGLPRISPAGTSPGAPHHVASQTPKHTAQSSRTSVGGGQQKRVSGRLTGKKGVTAQCKPRLAADELASWHAHGGPRCRCRAWADGRSEPLFISSPSGISPPPSTRGSDPTAAPSLASTGEQRGAGGKLGCRRWVVLMRCAVPQRRRRASNQARCGAGHSVANSHRIHAASRFLHAARGAMLEREGEKCVCCHGVAFHLSLFCHFCVVVRYSNVLCNGGLAVAV